MTFPGKSGTLHVSTRIFGGFHGAKPVTGMKRQRNRGALRGEMRCGKIQR